jgi:hypothetical protein
MKKKIKEIVMRWRDRQVADAKLEFTYNKKGESKSFNARIAGDDTDKIEIELVSIKGYSEKYVKRQLSHFFNLFNVSLQESISPGDEILTRYGVTNPPTVGATLSLPAETYYYAVNDGLVYCNGQQLGRACKAIYLGHQIDRCSMDSEPVRYTKFKLQ